RPLATAPRPMALWHVQSRTGYRLGRLFVQQLQLRQPLLRRYSRFLDSAPSPPAVDVRYGSSSTVALRFPSLLPRRARPRGADSSPPSLSRLSLHCSSTKRNPEPTRMSGYSATTRRRAGRSSPERALSLASK